MPNDYPRTKSVRVAATETIEVELMSYETRTSEPKAIVDARASEMVVGATYAIHHGAGMPELEGLNFVVVNSQNLIDINVNADDNAPHHIVVRAEVAVEIGGRVRFETYFFAPGAPLRCVSLNGARTI